MAQPCPICAEPLDCGLHRVDRLPDGSAFLLCPAFEEFVVDGSKIVQVPMPQGVPHGPGDHQAPGPPTQD